MKRKHADSYTSFEFLKEQFYDQPGLYEASFRLVRPYLYILRSFGSLKRLLEFAADNKPAIRQDIAKDLKALARVYPHLKQQIIEVLMFVLWDEWLDKYGTGRRFSKGYWDLIQEIEPRMGGDLYEADV
ncbi:MAG: hypothetical protein AAB038_00655 [Planctomycetota bacterium]